MHTHIYTCAKTSACKRKINSSCLAYKFQMSQCRGKHVFNLLGFLKTRSLLLNKQIKRRSLRFCRCCLLSSCIKVLWLFKCPIYLAMNVLSTNVNVIATHGTCIKRHVWLPVDSLNT